MAEELCNVEEEAIVRLECGCRHQILLLLDAVRGRKSVRQINDAESRWSKKNNEQGRNAMSTSMSHVASPLCVGGSSPVVGCWR